MSGGAMNESSIPIRPMTLGEILDKAIRLYRQNFLKFIGIFAIPYIPLMLLQMAFSVLYTFALLGVGSPDLANSSPELAGGVAIGSLIGTLIVLIASIVLVGGFATAALTRAVADNYVEKPIGILDSYRAVMGSVPKLLMALGLCFLLLLLLLVWGFIPIIGWFSGPGIIVFFSLIVVPLIAPIAALENRGVIQTIRRAWDLGRSRFWWLMGFALVLGLLGQLIVTGPVYLISSLLQAALATLPNVDFQLQSIINTVISTLINLATGLLYSPLQLTMITVVYFDLRARNEGLDIALELSRLNESPNDTSTLPELSDRQNRPLMEGIDIGRFALLSLIGVALFGCYFIFIFGMLGLMTSGF
jgi:hypothetical protein